MKFKLVSPWWAAVVCGLASASAQAQLAPFGISISETITHQDNVFRSVASQRISDWLSTTSVQGTFDQSFGRQRFKANAGVDVGQYKGLSQMNHTGYRLGGEFDWSTVNNLSGSLGANSSQRLYRYGIEGTTPFAGKNIETTNHVFSRAQLGGVARWTLLGGVDFTDRSYSVASFAANEVNQWSADLGARYQASPDLSFTLSGRQTEGEFPKATTTASDGFSSSSLGLGVNWQASATSNINLTVGYSTEDHDLQASRSFMNGSARWNWTPSGRLKVSAGLRRDSSGNTALVPGEASSAATPSLLSQSINTSADLSVTWELTSKISLVSGMQQAENSYSALSVAGKPTAGTATSRLYSLGARYKVTRTIDLGCSASREERTADSAIVTVIPGYTANTLTCMGQIAFQ